MRDYALLRAFDARLAQLDGPIGDEATLPVGRKELEEILFLSFGRMQTRSQYLHLKKLTVGLGNFIALSEADRNSIAALRTYSDVIKNCDAKTKAALTEVMQPALDHYKTVLSRSFRAVSEMNQKVEAFCTRFETERHFPAGAS